jgi:phosphonate transport system ATP-binding protein
MGDSLTQPLLSLVNAEVRYQDSVALHDINLTIQKGEKIALVGRSGSGKSTLLKLIYETLPEITALVPQDEGLVETLSVYHNVYMGQLRTHSSFYNLINLIHPFKQRVEEVDAVLAKVQLQDKCFDVVKQLSGGQRQRTAVARSLYQGGELLLADEPVSAVDELQAGRLLQILSTDFSTTIFALHDTQLALTHCTRVIGLHDGRIVLDEASEHLSATELTRLYCDEA